MPAPATVAEFLEVIRKSVLVPDDRLQAETHRLRLLQSPHVTVDQAAAALVDAGLLTRFQAKQMKLGRYKRFEIASKYRLLELLGVGGMGAVYLCEHMFMKRLVALKVLPVEKLQDPSALLRFYREARAVAALDHPNIVRAYDIDKYEQMHFLVMEYVDGASIQEVVARHGPLSPMRAANYVLQSAHGLHHAHQLGMVHRDIKPGNLLLERTGYVKILDMGLARFFDQKNDNLTEKFDNNCVLGTADYLAPEQAVSNVVDIRADIYALGGSFYFMLTGQSPFPDGTIAHKLLAHQKEEPRALTEFRRDVPAELQRVLNRMMRKNPAERHQTPQELYDDLAAIVAESPTPPPTHEMPNLCPAVLSLTGHAVDKARGANPRLVAPPRPMPAAQPQTLGYATALQDPLAGDSSSADYKQPPGSGLQPPSTSPLYAGAPTRESVAFALSPGQHAPTHNRSSSLDLAAFAPPRPHPTAGVPRRLYLVGVASGLVMALVTALVGVVAWQLFR